MKGSRLTEVFSFGFLRPLFREPALHHDELSQSKLEPVFTAADVIVAAGKKNSTCSQVWETI